MILRWWKEYQERKRAIAEMNTVEWKRKNLTNACPYLAETIFKYKCTVSGLACTAFDCYVDLPTPQNENEQCEILD